MKGFLTLGEIALRLKTTKGVVYNYRARGTLPPPDDFAGNVPVWAEQSFEEWLVARPGRGWRKGLGR